MVDCAKAGTAIAAAARIRMDFMTGLSGQAFSREWTPHANKARILTTADGALRSAFPRACAKMASALPPSRQSGAPLGSPAMTSATLSGFGSHFASEAVEGALPEGRNSPQQPAFGLYAEQLSGTAFTAPRAENRRAWLYRMRPSAEHPLYRRYKGGPLFAPVTSNESVTPQPPNRLRWDPLPMPEAPADFVDGLVTMVANRDPASLEGVAVHVYRANRDMEGRYFFNADGELIVIPEMGRLDLATEMGRIALEPGEIALIPRGVRFSASLPDGEGRGYVAENHGALFRLPELGPIGANGLANPRDFLTPRAAFEDRDGRCELVQKHL